jgi:DNA ligase (NAD+)
MNNLRYFLLCLDRVYQEGFESPLRDNEYDEIHELYLDNGGEVIRGDMSSSDKAHHVYPELKGTIRKVHFITEKDRLTNGKVKSQKSLETWLKNTLKILYDAGLVKNDGLEMGFYTKFDGVSVILEVEDGNVKSAITRGDKDTGEGQNKTGIFSNTRFTSECKILGVKKFGLKCEALVSKDTFPEYNRRFGSNKLIDERSAATAILNQDFASPEQMRFLVLMPLMIEIDDVEYPIPCMNTETEMEHRISQAFDWVDDVFPMTIVKLPLNNTAKMLEWIKTSIEFVKDKIDDLEYPVDGIVIRLLDEKQRAYLGRNTDDCINNWERAYKFPPAQAKTTVVDVEQQIGYLGKVSFIAKVSPVKLKNKTIKSISIGSLDRFKSLNLAIGDEVIVQYDIIPYLTVDSTCRRSDNHPIDAIVNCPVCGEPLQMVPELSCVNSSCPSRIIGKIYNYCSKVGIEDIGPNTIERMVVDGLISNISDLYTLTAEKLRDVSGFGPVESKNIIASINKVHSVEDYVLLGSLGIPGASRKVFEKLLSHIKFNKLISMGNNKDDIKKLTELPGIKSKSARKILTGIEENLDEIERLLSYITIKEAKSFSIKVCFTKVRDKDFEKYLNSIQVRVVEALTRDTNLLITGAATSSKVEKALKWGIPVLTLQEAYDKFGYTG